MSSDSLKDYIILKTATRINPDNNDNTILVHPAEKQYSTKLHELLADSIGRVPPDPPSGGFRQVKILDETLEKILDAYKSVVREEAEERPKRNNPFRLFVRKLGYFSGLIPTEQILEDAILDSYRSEIRHQAFLLERAYKRHKVEANKHIPGRYFGAIVLEKSP